MPETLFTPETLPLTLSTIVHTIWKKYIKYNVFRNDTLLQLALVKQGIFNPLHKNYQETLKT
jgi:hypothetical protein